MTDSYDGLKFDVVLARILDPDRGGRGRGMIRAVDKSLMVARLVLGGVFVFSGGVKLLDPAAFAEIIDAYALLPEWLTVPVAWGLPVVEVIAGLGLMLGLPVALTAVTLMLGLFIFVLWFGILQGLDVDCGCFGSAERATHESLRRAMYRDFGLLALALMLHMRNFSTRRRTEARPMGADCPEI